MEERDIKRSGYQCRIEYFMRQAGQCVLATPAIPDAKIRQLRAALILEEALETVKALGFEAYLHRDHIIEPGVCRVQLIETHEPDLIEIVDGCCDVMVVTLGTLSAIGVSDLPVMGEVLDSNDSKFIDGYEREDGKWMKGPSYKPADLKRVIGNQGNPF